MTLEAIVIPLRLKQKSLPSWTGMHCVPSGLIFVFYGRWISGHAAVTGWHWQPFFGTKTRCQHPSQRSELMWKPARKPVSGGSNWEHSLCFQKRTEKSWSRWGSRWTPRPHVSLTTVFSDHRGLNGLSHHVTELEQDLRPLSFPQRSTHIISFDMRPATKWPASRKYKQGHERSGRRNTCSHRDMGLQATDPHSPIRKRAS